MSEPIFIVDVGKKSPPQTLDPVSFAELGIRERDDLEEWVAAHPAVLGESLLILTTEFDRFDKSDRRIDLLALDQDGVLVVVELKLDASGSHADLQALRYAAFCSTMTMQDAQRLLAEWRSISEAEAVSAIKEFLGRDLLPELSNRPRIILAAGSMDDEEITSTVLWLRGFGIDMTCVEMTPYRLPGQNQIALVPRTIIPIPEAKDFIVKVEQKEVHRATATQENVYYPLWVALTERFNALGVRIDGRDFRVRRPRASSYLQVPIARTEVHYEWVVRFRQNALDVALHSEFRDVNENERVIRGIKEAGPTIFAGINAKWHVGIFGDGARMQTRPWREARLRLTFDNPASPENAEEAAKVMKLFIERTLPLLPADISNSI
jgi:hypothetical protein